MRTEIKVFRMPPENTNSVLVTNGALAAVFDPWGTTENWLKLLRDENLTLKNIFCTHGHYDHVSAIPGLIADTGAKWFMHPDDIPVIEWSNEILPRIGAKKIDLKKIPPCPIAPGAMEILPGLSAEAIHTPGHSAGSIAFYFPNEKLLIAGDTIFQDGYGRTDLPTGSESHMRESLKKIRNMNLADDTTVIHGHGPDTTIGYLKEKNPFFCL